MYQDATDAESAIADGTCQAYLSDDCANALKAFALLLDGSYARVALAAQGVYAVLDPAIATLMTRCEAVLADACAADTMNELQVAVSALARGNNGNGMQASFARALLHDAAWQLRDSLTQLLS